MSRIRWTADRDGVSHAHTGGPRTVCGQRAIDERHAWPRQSRCPECREAVGAPTSHIAEADLLRGYGVEPPIG